ncbi:myosin-binding protein 1-like protein [Tanacetum coccineum]
MSHPSSSHIVHTAGESGLATILYRQPTCNSEEDPSEHWDSEREIGYVPDSPSRHRLYIRCWTLLRGWMFRRIGPRTLQTRLERWAGELGVGISISDTYVGSIVGGCTVGCVPWIACLTMSGGRSTRNTTANNVNLSNELVSEVARQLNATLPNMIAQFVEVAINLTVVHIKEPTPRRTLPLETRRSSSILTSCNAGGLFTFRINRKQSLYLSMGYGCQRLNIPPYTVATVDGSVVSEIDGESVVDRLKRQVEHDKKLMGILYKELEEERNASAVATNQAMAMITRLQEEKSALYTEALQSLRVLEERAEYDNEALQKANDLIEQKDKQIQDLEELLRNTSQDYKEMTPQTDT